MEIKTIPSKIIKIKNNKSKKCPICKKKISVKFSPFCSKKCSDLDLINWLSDGY